MKAYNLKKSDFTFSCFTFIATKSLQEIIPNKKSKINKNITEKNSSGYKEIDESQEAEILLSRTASKQLMKKLLTRRGKE